MEQAANVKKSILSPILYLILLYSGILILLFYACFAFNENRFQLPQIPVIPVFSLYFIGIALLIIAQIFWCILFYQVWRFIISKSIEASITPVITKPGIAVGFLFIPVFNLYWMFYSFIGLNRTLNKYLKHNAKNTRHSLTVSILIPVCVTVMIPLSYLLSNKSGPESIFILIILNLINISILYPVYICSAISISKGLEVLSTNGTMIKINGINDLFNYGKFGVNYFLFFFLLAGTFIESITNFNLSTLIEGGYFELFWMHPIHLLVVSITSVLGLLFLIYVIALVKKDLLIVIIFVIGRTLLSIIHRYVMTSVHIEGMTFGEPLAIKSLVYTLTYYLFFITALLTAVKYTHPKQLGFIFIFSAAYLLHEVLIQAYDISFHNSSIQFSYLLTSFISGVTDGLLIWAAMIFNLRVKGYTIVKKEIIAI